MVMISIVALGMAAYKFEANSEIRGGFSGPVLFPQSLDLVGSCPSHGLSPINETAAHGITPNHPRSSA